MAAMNKFIGVFLILFSLGNCSAADNGIKADSPSDGKKDIMTEEPYTYHGEPLRVGVIGLNVTQRLCLCA